MLDQITPHTPSTCRPEAPLSEPAKNPVYSLALARNTVCMRNDLVHMDTSATFIIRILKILKFHIFMSPKFLALNNYIHEECNEKSPLKNMLNFGKYKKDIFCISQNTTYFLTGFFCICSFYVYLFIYLASYFLET
jgi:hypothetical protein